MHTHVYRYWTDEETDILRKYSPTHSNEELAAMLPGRSASSVAARLKYLRLLRPESYYDRIPYDRAVAVNNRKWRERVGSATANAAILEGRTKVITRDKARMRIGLEPLTRIRYNGSSAARRIRISNARYNLRRQGYTIPTGSNVCYYDDNTQRDHGRAGQWGESYYERKYHFRFRPVSEMGKEEEQVRATHQEAPPIIFD